MNNPELLAVLEKDANGNIITRPVAEWITGTTAGIGVLLAIRHIGSPQELQSGGKWAQLALTPQQCLDLAARLTTLANKVLAPDSRNPLN